jgi:hypothetical protein
MIKSIIRKLVGLIAPAKATSDGKHTKTARELISSRPANPDPDAN